MNAKKRFTIACFSGLRVGFCNALATSISIGMIAAVSIYSPKAESRLSHAIRELPVLDKVFDWGLIPAAAAFLTVSFLGFGLSELGAHCRMMGKINHYFAQHVSLHTLEILITAFCGIAHAAINLYSLKAEALDYGVNVPLASLVGAVAAANEIPRKMARCLFNLFHKKVMGHRVIPQEPQLFRIQNPLQAAMELSQARAQPQPQQLADAPPAPPTPSPTPESTEVSTEIQIGIEGQVTPA